MKKYILLLFAICTSSMMMGQFVELSYGSQYSKMSFYTLSNDNEQEFANNDWHIAVTASGTQDAGVLINEAAPLMGDAMELWLAPTNEYDVTIQPRDLSILLYNPDSSWNVGAFNSLRDPENPLDYGWGTYNPQTMQVEGDEVFVIRFRTGEYVKFMIESLALTTYNFKWANLDGSNETTFQVDKQNFRDNDILLIDLKRKDVIPVDANADLMFARYNESLSDGMGGFLDYNVTGVLSLPGVTVAQADGVDTMSVAWDDYRDSLSARVDIIGQDWKEFDLTTFQWVVAQERVYFVKDKQADVWKLVFIDFEGSSTGNIVFTKEKVGAVSTIDQIDGLSNWILYPNPVDQQMSIILEAEKRIQGQFQIVNQLGQVVQTWTQDLNSGMITYDVDVSHLKTGSYQLILTANGQRATESFIKK